MNCEVYKVTDNNLSVHRYILHHNDIKNIPNLFLTDQAGALIIIIIKSGIHFVHMFAPPNVV